MPRISDSSTPDTPILVGRDREHSVLRERLDAALAGRGGIVLIGGEAGVGKTALAESICADAAQRGALVLIGRCYDLAETPPYGPWREIVVRQREREGATAPLFLDPASDDAATPPNQATLFEWAREFFARRAMDRPIVALLDDFHWADPASLDLLRFLAREATTLPLLLIVTYRADELTRRHPLAILLPLLVREAHAERLDLRRLGRDDTRLLVRARYALEEADETRLVVYLQDHAEGNPFYSEEILRTLAEEGQLRPDGEAWVLGDLARARVPALLRQVIDGRLERLGDEARDALAVAAVIGQELPLSLWANLAGVPEDDLLSLIERAAEARLIEVGDGDAEIQFAHALIREALYAGLLPSRRRQWHRRVGEALAARSRPDPDAVASHFQRAGDPRAAAWLIRAGVRARRAYALLTAAERFEAALALLEGQGGAARERAIVLYQLARMRRYADPHGALAYLDDAAGLADEAGDALLAAYIACFRGYLGCTTGAIRRGLADLSAAVASVDALGRDDPRQLAALQEELSEPPDAHHYRGALASWLALAGRYAEAREQGDRVVAAMTEQAGPGAATSFEGNAWRGLAGAHAALGHPDDAHLAYERAAATYRAAEHWYQVGNTRAIELYEVALPYRPDDLAGRLQLAEDAAAAWARASGALADLPPRIAHLPLLVIEGDWAAAREIALAVRAPGGRTQWRPFATTFLASIARDQGDAALAWELVRERLPGGPGTEPGDAIFLDATPLQRLAALLALDAGDLPLARAWLEAHDRWHAWGGAVLGLAEGQALWARYQLAARDQRAASQAAERSLALATEPRQPLALLVARRLLGQIALVNGVLEAATEHLAAALALAEACAAPYERAQTFLVLAEARDAAGERDLAKSALGEARPILEALDARPALARLAALAERFATTASSPAARAYPAGLSAREVEVLRLVAGGLTDAEVAGRLYLSPRTVSGHLRSIYGKLGVSSRAAATRFAIEHDLA